MLLKKQIFKACQIICFFAVSRCNFIIKKSCSPNILVDKIKSVVALKILVLSLGLSDIFPKSKISVEMLLVLSNKL